ncbi:MAG: transcriptional regulator [Candidatus Aminicenantes bacterium]|nr:transcriptional regulator [Candidatus Aminicenantes bacterium]NIM84944.1 transcriptional regulator [Candidatus Aminicenantes bacterium]NIN24458.1 transcriptional regulator [Candidatus Aminicenantes bacterium]NIN48222.1 transcriptional regulator [Candidatus Aminicenantes bacterium]NIN91125.1 transcriptional regulator [Candidatus Aminicenantes bacterium]
MKTKKTDKLIEIIKQAGVLRPRDLDNYGIQREYLRRLYNLGIIIKHGRGLYSLKNVDISEHHSLAEVCKKIPDGVICLLSALHFHEITTELPYEVWIALDNKSRQPKMESVALRVMRFSGRALAEGIDEHKIEGVKVRVYNPAKTAADCFKYRNKIGLDVALDALRECWEQKRCTMDQLWEYARICRVSNVMRSYLETLV